MVQSLGLYHPTNDLIGAPRGRQTQIGPHAVSVIGRWDGTTGGGAAALPPL